MKFTIILGAALAVAVSASAALALPIDSMSAVRTAHDGTFGSQDAAIVQVKSMPSRAIYHRGHHHRNSQRGLRSNRRY